MKWHRDIEAAFHFRQRDKTLVDRRDFDEYREPAILWRFILIARQLSDFASIGPTRHDVDRTPRPFIRQMGRQLISSLEVNSYQNL